jgi:hypothetical protein
MAGYVTQTRPLGGQTLRASYGFVGQPGQPGDVTFPVTQQTTTSWRSGQGDQDEITRDDLRIFRNGFTTYDPVYDRGHTFSTEKREILFDPQEAYFLWNDRGYPKFYRGPIFPAATTDGYYPSWLFPALPAISDSEVGRLGAIAIQRTLPLSPQASSAQFIGELFAGLPHMIGASLWRDRAASFRSYGDEYLNVQFGWAPFISDLQKAAKSLKKASQTIKQIERDNGRMVRRKFRFRPETVATEQELTLSGLRFVNQTVGAGAGLAPNREILATKREVWFSGAYSYYLPVDSSISSKFERYSAFADTLLGGRLTPATLWELAPWSWLVDWKFDVGVVLNNASRLAEDSLVIRYGYLMVHDRADRTVVSNSGPSNMGWKIPSGRITFRSERKARFRATPYGFGVDTKSLKDSQWAILAALGMTKGSGTLR